MLATIRDNTWNVLNLQHKTPNSKGWDYLDTPGGGHEKIKGPAHMVEGDHHLRKVPNPQLPAEWWDLQISRWLTSSIVGVTNLQITLHHRLGSLPSMARTLEQK